jgi:hypothetical protein
MTNEGQPQINCSSAILGGADPLGDSFDPADQSMYSPADVTSLCNAADAASRAHPRARRVPFTWRGHRYRVHCTSFLQLRVHTAKGEPVAERDL